MSEYLNASIDPLGMRVFRGSFGSVRLRRLWHTSIRRHIGEAQAAKRESGLDPEGQKFREKGPLIRSNQIVERR
jgi:hypothetical protein